MKHRIFYAIWSIVLGTITTFCWTALFYFDDEIVGYCTSYVSTACTIVTVITYCFASFALVIATVICISEAIDPIFITEPKKQTVTPVENKTDEWLDRNVHKLPARKCKMLVLLRGFPQGVLCEWDPYDPTKFLQNDQPQKGYLGTARALEGPNEGSGFHAWEQNTHEFIHYKLR